MAKAYFGSRLSDHMLRTPEGYLVCLSVPIARTGWQEYRGREIGLDSEDLVRVWRGEDEVFHPAAIASFEGKTVTHPHPAEWVMPSNEATYHRGHCQNVRRGAGDLGECLVGDLFIKDPNLDDMIQNGLREVSCGYDCEYEPIGDGGGYAQRNIRGNHVAVVQSGRAGDRIAIRDEAITVTEEDEITSKEKPKMRISWRTLLGLGLKEYAKDASPEDMAEAMKAMRTLDADPEMPELPRKEEAPSAPPPPAPPSGGGGGDNTQLAILERILAMLEQLVESDKAVHASLPKEPEPEDALDGLLQQLEAPEEPPKELAPGMEDAEVIEPVPTLSGKEIPENPIPNADSRGAIAAIRAMKPIIAAIPDRAARKRATDALLNAFKQPPGSQKAAYGDMLRPKAPERTTDMGLRADPSDEEYGRKLKEEFHRKQIKLVK